MIRKKSMNFTKEENLKEELRRKELIDIVDADEATKDANIKKQIEKDGFFKKL